MLNPAQEQIAAMLRESLGDRAAAAFEKKMLAWNASRPKPKVPEFQLHTLRYIAAYGLEPARKIALECLREHGA